MKLALGFITYNQVSAKYLAYFLPALKEALHFLPENSYKVMVFDNSNEDENTNRLALEFFDYKHQFKIEYHSKSKNIGFGSAYNFLIARAKELEAEYFLLINPDTLPEKNSLFFLLKVLEEKSELAAVAPKILRWDFANFKKTRQIDSCGLLLRPGLKFIDLGQGEKDEGQYDDKTIIAPSGAAGLFRLSALDKIREKGFYFDPDFFMYKEDCDLAYRLKLAGLKSALVHQAIIYHDRSAASYSRGFLAFWLNRKKKSKEIKSWSFYSQHLLFIKHFSKETFYSRMIIIIRIFILFIFSLILEQYNLKQYKKMFNK
jgi:GT2 family glycosyltransferase